jgi:hypothetical protein
MVKIDSSSLVSLEKVKISGPFVASLDRRKEDNNHQKMSNEKLRENLKAVKKTMLTELKKISSFSLN